MERDIDEILSIGTVSCLQIDSNVFIYRFLQAINKTLIPSCEKSMQDSKLTTFGIASVIHCIKILTPYIVERALEDAEKQLQKSNEMQTKREKFLEESDLHLKNIAQQLREM